MENQGGHYLMAAKDKMIPPSASAIGGEDFDSFAGGLHQFGVRRRSSFALRLSNLKIQNDLLPPSRREEPSSSRQPEPVPKP
jgi:hypothetical protein